MVTLQAFIDDSKSDIEERNLILAGYMQAAPAWIAFSAAWERVLKKTPSIDHFRMAEAQNLSGQFRGWSVADRDEKVMSLAKVIRQYDPPLSFECWVSQASFDKILRPVAPYDLKSAYFGCFYGVIVSVARFYATSGLDVPVDFIFDEQGGLGHSVVFWYDYIKALQQPQINRVLGSTPIFRDDKKVKPLQAADLLAWHMRRQKERRNANETRPLERFVYGQYHVEARITEKELSEMATKMAAITTGKDLHHKKTSVRRLLQGKRKP